MIRRKFIKNATLAVPAAGLTSCFGAKESKQEKGPYINFNNTYQWKMVTTWPPNFPVVGEGCNLLADWIKKMSGGRLEITVYGGGELIPSFESFDAVSNGAVEMGHGAAYYWAGKIPAAQFFAAVPFGMNAHQSNSWILSGEGGKLWEELYRPFDLLPITCGNTGIQMGGWFNKEINTIEDIQGLKMRIPGFGGKVFNRAGGTAVTVAGGEVYTNLERGVIDATEWIGPYHDYKMGFHQVAEYYYYPGWHEPGANLELIVNKTKFQSLPTDLQEIIRVGALRLNDWMGAEFDNKNGIYLNKLINEEKVKLRKFPNEVLANFKVKTSEVLDELIQGDVISKKVHDSYYRFKDNINRWSRVSDEIYYQL